ncbi:chromo domain protein [Entamoeba histolytica]|uniref:Chromo domain protein n=1 Tax=Entamoeba histolytica TaxID=5759 RepID=A0A175JX73_ENTHI|nr:chromo domain protein [Entamoeba histolytica]
MNFVFPEQIIKKKVDSEGNTKVLVKWKGLLPSENSWVSILDIPFRDIHQEIENTQLFRISKGLVIIKIIAETEYNNQKYILVEWNDRITTYVTISFLIEHFPFLLFEACCHTKK